jgi:hypothetical protein
LSVKTAPFSCYNRPWYGVGCNNRIYSVKITYSCRTVLLKLLVLTLILTQMTMSSSQRLWSLLTAEIAVQWAIKGKFLQPYPVFPTLRQFILGTSLLTYRFSKFVADYESTCCLVLIFPVSSTTPPRYRVNW